MCLYKLNNVREGKRLFISFAKSLCCCPALADGLNFAVLLIIGVCLCAALWGVENGKRNNMQWGGDYYFLFVFSNNPFVKI